MEEGCAPLGSTDLCPLVIMQSSGQSPFAGDMDDLKAAVG